MLCLLLSGCGGVKTLRYLNKRQLQLNLEKPTPLQMEKIHWHIITSENAEEVFKN